MTQKDILMANLGLTAEEADAVLADDKRIDRGEKLFELSDELKAGAKKARQAERKAPTAPIKRERKEDTDKRRLIDFLVSALGNEVNVSLTECDSIGVECDVINPEREFTFIYNGRKFKVVLSCPRS